MRKSHGSRHPKSAHWPAMANGGGDPCLGQAAPVPTPLHSSRRGRGRYRRLPMKMHRTLSGALAQLPPGEIAGPLPHCAMKIKVSSQWRALDFQPETGEIGTGTASSTSLGHILCSEIIVIHEGSLLSDLCFHRHCSAEINIPKLNGLFLM
jgi:hypothetical protein